MYTAQGVYSCPQQQQQQQQPKPEHFSQPMYADDDSKMHEDYQQQPQKAQPRPATEWQAIGREMHAWVPDAK